jgi:hypothetical protein
VAQLSTGGHARHPDLDVGTLVSSALRNGNRCIQRDVSVATRTATRHFKFARTDALGFGRPTETDPVGDLVRGPVTADSTAVVMPNRKLNRSFGRYPHVIGNSVLGILVTIRDPGSAGGTYLAEQQKAEL